MVVPHTNFVWMRWNELVRTAAALKFNFDSAFENKFDLTQLDLT